MSERVTSPSSSSSSATPFPVSRLANTSRMYRRSEYPGKLIEKLRELRQDEQLCDLELYSSVDSEPILAHKNILAAATPYFHAMFTSGLMESEERQYRGQDRRKARQKLVLQGLEHHTLEGLVDFMYTGEMNLDQRSVQDILVAADMIQLKEVVDICSEFLKTELHQSNAIGIWRFAEGHNLVGLQDFSINFIYNNFFSVSVEEEFLEANKDIVCELISSEYLRVDSEYQVFFAAMSWINHNITNRRRFIFDILKHIRLPLVATKLLDSYVDACNDISLKVALTSVRRDLINQKGSLVSLYVKPRQCAKKNIYVIGGSRRELGSAWTRSECTYQTVECFDTFNQEWRRVASMNIGRILPGIAIISGRIFVCGGEVDSQILANGEVYEPADDSWSPIASMMVPRCEFGLCAVDGFLYAFGGWVGEDIGGSIEMYDPGLNEWRMQGKMQDERFSMGIVTYQGLIYIVGGCTHSRRHMQELVSYNPVTGEWTTLCSMLVPRSQMGCVVLDDHLYVLGGTNRHNEVLQSGERYSFVEDKWEDIPPMHHARASPAVAASNGKIYAIGGDQISEVNFYRARITISAVECFDPLTNEWRLSSSLPQSRSESGAVVI
ncbi:actin-binding protein IPP [Eurytemora carolleeae]|uniref:actin-binding protein IPP n=1 Tax=Eurytemora carolleeae TaxID=1294199 RepID=UPI000C764EEA|nr:actin-binding protein IPP [Eurytemora carolleeae]|eukprot:XP_023322367.1 actin-binding protein IPP-like [Eurytemora affinis]